MHFSKRHILTFSVLSLVQFNTSALNAGTVLNLIETTAAGSEGNVKAAITRKLDMQKLRQAQVERWIDGIQSLKHTQPDLKVGEQSLTDALKVLENLKAYLDRKVALVEGESTEMDGWAQSQAQNINIPELKTKYLELRGKRIKYTQSSAKAIQEQTTQWALLVKPESFAPALEKMTEPLAQALSLVETYEDAWYWDKWDKLQEKDQNSKKTGGRALNQQEKTTLSNFEILFNVGSPEKMIERMNQAYSSKELFDYLTQKAAIYAVKSILSPATLPDPAGPAIPAGTTDDAHVDEARGQAANMAHPGQTGAVANSATGGAPNPGKKGAGGGRKRGG